MKDHLRSLLQNLAAGARLGLFLPVRAERFRAGADPLLLLILLDLAASVFADWLENLPDPTFNIYAVPGFGFYCAMLLLAAYIARPIAAGSRELLLLPTAILALAPVVYLVWYPLFWLQATLLPGWVPYTALYAAYVLWLFVATVRAVGMLQPVSWPRFGLAATLAFAVWFVPSTYLNYYSEFWYAASEDGEDEDPYAAFRDLDAESIFYAQPPLLERALAPLEAQRDGVVDTYFVGFAGYARQDVFLKETRYAQALFDRRFGTAGRSLVLINHLSTHAATPLANGHNLAAGLKAIGAKMNPEEDVLVLYMTSHGSKQDGLSVDFWPLRLNDIPPDALKRYLDDAGIKWRVIMVSACYSGTFVEPLKDPYTIIATAAAEDRKSFGCGDHNDFTYFGEAVLKDQLNHRHDFAGAFHAAAVEIGKRETAEGIQEQSEPQVFVGDAIAPVLEALERRLMQESRTLVEHRERAPEAAPTPAGARHPG